MISGPPMSCIYMYVWHDRDIVNTEIILKMPTLLLCPSQKKSTERFGFGRTRTSVLKNFDLNDFLDIQKIKFECDDALFARKVYKGHISIWEINALFEMYYFRDLNENVNRCNLICAPTITLALHFLGFGRFFCTKMFCPKTIRPDKSVRSKSNA